jgi:betaine reductase
MTHGDPTYAGPLTGVELGLTVYHIFEPAIKQLIDPERYADLLETLELGLAADEIAAAVEQARTAERR